MKAKTLRSVVPVLGLTLAISAPVFAQEDVVPVESAEETAKTEPEAKPEPAAERPQTRFLAELEYLGATTIGGDVRIGTEQSDAGDLVRSLYLPEENSSGTRYRFGWTLPDDWGEVVAVYWSHDTDSRKVASRPGEFVLGVTETLPFLNGVADDGLADAIDGMATFKTRDGRLDWRFPVLDRPRVRLGVAFGLRRVSHRQDSSIAYFALDPGLPPLIAPDGAGRADLAPNPDRVYTLSEFSGRGLELVLDSTVPLVGDRLQLEASASFALLRGTTRASYGSLTSYYGTQASGDLEYITFDELVALLEAGDYGSPRQEDVTFAMESTGRSTTASALDLALGLRSRVWRGLEVAAGVRMSRFDDVVYDIRPTGPKMSPSGDFTFGVDEGWRSVGYEAFYAAVAYRF